MSEEATSSSQHTSSEATQIELPSSAAPETDTSRQPLIPFACHLCNMHQTCDYFGDHPPFAATNQFSEDCYIKKDPFAPNPGSSKASAEYLLVLGANCHRCGHQTCRSPNCSIYYRHTVCLQCAERAIKEYPTEIQTKIKKNIQNQS